MEMCWRKGGAQHNSEEWEKVCEKGAAVRGCHSPCVTAAQNLHSEGGWWRRWLCRTEPQPGKREWSGELFRLLSLFLTNQLRF